MRTPPFISIPQKHYSTHISVQSKHAIFVVCVKYFLQLTCLLYFRCDSCQTVENMLITKLNDIDHQTQCYWTSNSMLLGIKLNAIGYQTQCYWISPPKLIKKEENRIEVLAHELTSCLVY